jgi:hypothetical protein
LDIHFWGKQNQFIAFKLSGESSRNEDKGICEIFDALPFVAKRHGS